MDEKDWQEVERRVDAYGEYMAQKRKGSIMTVGVGPDQSELITSLREESATFRRLLESKQEELAREQKLREDREKAHNIERIQWRESLREKDEETQSWRRQAESKY